MKIVNAGYNYRHPADFYISRSYGSGDYLLLILKTDAFFVFNNEKHIAPPNSVVLFKKGTPQLYGALSEEYVNDWIHFDIDDEEKNEIQKLDIPFDTILSVNSTTVFSELIRNIFCEKYSQNLYKEDSMNLYFNLILKKLSEMLKSPALEKEKPYYEIFCGLRNEIQLTPQNNWNIDKTVPLEKQDLLPITKEILTFLYRDYICGDIERARLDKILNENEIKYQNELKEKYNPDNIFKTRKSNVKTEQIVNENTSIVTYKESFFSKIINKIKLIFHK